MGGEGSVEFLRRDEVDWVKGGGAMHTLVTSALDLLGLLLIVAAIAVFVAPWSLPGAIGAAGVATLCASWLIDRRRGV